MEALRAGRIQTGLSQLRRALELNPRLVMARVSLAKQLAHMKQTDEAIEILSEGLMLMPTNTWLTRELATLWRRAGNVEGAYELLRAALPYAKGNANYHAAFAQAAQDRRDCSTAVKHYRIALESKNWQAEWRTRLADCLYESGDRAGAEAEYVSALKLRNLPPEQRARAERKLAELR
jgi:Flp pilus assembly protein TadD